MKRHLSDLDDMIVAEVSGESEAGGEAAEAKGGETRSGEGQGTEHVPGGSAEGEHVGSETPVAGLRATFQKHPSWKSAGEGQGMGS